MDRALPPYCRRGTDFRRVRPESASGYVSDRIGTVTGLVYLPASSIAGALWTVNPAWAFAVAVATSPAALVLFLSPAEPRRLLEAHS